MEREPAIDTNLRAEGIPVSVVDMGLNDNQQAVLMAIAFALAGVGTIALPTSWPWELRIIPALVAAVFAGVKEFLGGAAPTKQPGSATQPTKPQTPRQIAAVIYTDPTRPLMDQGYIPTGEVIVGAKKYVLLEKGA